MAKITLYHGSPNMIEKPQYGYGKVYNDYGLGFYCTEHVELAKEWACSENVDGYANRYELNVDGLNILNLTKPPYSILHWLALLVKYRDFTLTTPIMRMGFDWLQKNFAIDLSPYDAIIGYRADDSYFSFARAFLGNEISLNQLSYAMRLGTLGEQFVLKSKKAFDRIQFAGFEIADNTEYFPKRKSRDISARAAYRREIEKGDLDGLYMRDLIREEVRADDPRIR